MKIDELKKLVNIEFPIEDINRIEIIGPNGREFVKSQNTVKNVKMFIQDNGKTLKIVYDAKDLNLKKEN
jgi:hypothetical protein